MANSFRGEVEIEIGELKYTLRPSFEGLLEIEERSGLGLMELVNQIGNGRLSTKQAVAIIYGGIIGSGGKVEFKELGDACVQHGMLEISTKAAVFLSKVIQSRQKKTDLPSEEVK